ncbi:aminofutalosine synthase MqnE [Carboxydothermus ferrireducens]|uniref:Aminodeoxyfutalosine synthase n=1 Tax=Carboxydothermus ferrireducens DSM 11255 TaxID=1119529 RepID=A0ABX2REP7_9THEO|nr:aminofutalosine synthase MqnE [Carboxydothermus ferrireducens]NYE58556.1 aminodeoxyfutalosine synthase [Carboxydothermus ferrireducens DSM 11255]
MFAFADKNLEKIYDKVEKGERLSFEDGLTLFNSSDLIGIGYLANIVRERKNGNKAYFIVNRHINPTNICVNRCKLCAFGVDKDSPEAYQMSLDEIEARALESKDDGISEIHIVGGLHPDLPFDFYVEMVERVSRALPGVHIQAFTAVEIDYFSRISGKSLEEVLTILKNAGLGSLPGGGAEVFSERVRKKICEKKISGERWLEVMRTAHKLGLRSNATMLYGHIETVEERLMHLIKLRELQDETGGFMSFIPLAFHPKNTGLEGEIKTLTTGVEDLKMLAISRLMLDNFDHIKAFWIMVGPKLAQISLSFGVDDIDGTVVEERITHAAGATTSQAMTKKEILHLIREAGRQPVERDTLYNVVREVF